MKYLQQSDFLTVRPIDLRDLINYQIPEDDLEDYNELELISEQIDFLLAYPDNLLNRLETQMIDIASGLLKTTFDVDEIFYRFTTAPEWSDAVTYAEGDLIRTTTGWFESLVDSNIDFTPESSPNQWASVYRNPSIVRAIVDMVLYDLYATVESVDIRKIRKCRYEEAMEFLKKAATGQHGQNLPIKKDPETNENSKKTGHFRSVLRRQKPW